MPKRVVPLTDWTIRKAKPGSKPRYLFDGGGLFLVVEKGKPCRWRWKYLFQGKPCMISLGEYPKVTIAEARKQRDEGRAMLEQGINPSAARKEARTPPPVDDVDTFERFATNYYAMRARSGKPSSSTMAVIMSILRRDVFPYIGQTPVSTITKDDIKAVLDKILGRGAISMAHATAGILVAILDHAEALDKISGNPARSVRKLLPPRGVINHRAALTEVKDLPRLGELLRAIESYKGTPTVRAALKLAPMLAVRPGELRRMEWADVDLGAGEWRFTVSKVKLPHIVPLARQAVEILRELFPLTGHGRYVFPGGRSADGSRPMSENAILAALRAMGFPREEVSGHGFRATFRTVGREHPKLRFPVDLLEIQLSHRIKRTSLGRAYDRTELLEERTAMMQRWADFLEELRTGEPPTPPVPF